MKKLAKSNNSRKMLTAIFVLTFCSIGTAEANVVSNPSFETDESTFIWGFPGVPTSFGDWGGDLSEIVSSENSISPYDGSQMLRFDASGNSADPHLSTSEVHQLIDVSAFSSSIQAGSATATASAWFNRVAGDSQTDTAIGLTVYAYSGHPSNFQSLIGSALASGHEGVLTDSATETWQVVTTSLLLPASTDFLDIRLVASENIFNDGSDPEFDGHYADLVTMEVTSVPIPGAIWLFGSGLIGLAGLKDKFNK